ncbi:branchpoint-bridging protein-like [Haliotis rufescens]|uniref:branchpoint-bridging protein-like n=1 Tax=Haliotis rufescens TaxID=6454 RepID=UPI00201EE0E6|nr:branchpoint-bridging protein-like [Haliotis rufescens]
MPFTTFLCRRCQSDDHHYTVCPNASCENKCANPMGHWFWRCPEPCSTCGETGHAAPRCMSGGTKPTGANNLMCHNCKELGHAAGEFKKPCGERGCGSTDHTSYTCPMRKARQKRGGPPPHLANYDCYRCGNMGHFASGCVLPCRWCKLLIQGHHARYCAERPSDTEHQASPKAGKEPYPTTPPVTPPKEEDTPTVGVPPVPPPKVQGTPPVAPPRTSRRKRTAALVTPVKKRRGVIRDDSDSDDVGDLIIIEDAEPSPAHRELNFPRVI